jgi:hypothetical protein
MVFETVIHHYQILICRNVIGMTCTLCADKAEYQWSVYESGGDRTVTIGQPCPRKPVANKTGNYLQSVKVSFRNV